MCKQLIIYMYFIILQSILYWHSLLLIIHLAWKVTSHLTHYQHASMLPLSLDWKWNAVDNTCGFIYFQHLFWLLLLIILSWCKWNHMPFSEILRVEQSLLNNWTAVGFILVMMTATLLISFVFSFFCFSYVCRHMHYMSSTNAGLWQGNMTWCLKVKEDKYHWVTDLYDRLNLTVIPAITEALIKCVQDRADELVKQWTEARKQQQIKMKVARTENQEARKKWVKQQAVRHT